MESLGLSQINARQDEKEVLIAIFETYHRRLFNYIYYRINNSYVAEDLTSAVFEKVIVGYSTYSKEKGNLEGWLFGIAKNCVNDYLRKQKRWQFTELNEAVDVKSKQGMPEEECLKLETNSEIIRALKILKDKERNIIALKFAAGLSNVEIARIMGLSDTNVGSIVYRSMKKLKKEIEKGDIICLKRA